MCFSKPESDAVLQVGAALPVNSVSSLSIKEERELIYVLFKTRVRLGIASRCSTPIQLGQLSLAIKEERELIYVLFKT